MDVGNGVRKIIIDFVGSYLGNQRSRQNSRLWSNEQNHELTFSHVVNVSFLQTNVGEEGIANRVLYG